MMAISAFSAPKGSSKGNRLKAGCYDSKVELVCESEDYAPGKAFEIHYQLVSASGDKFSFKELFYNESWNERTQDFFRYIESNGLDLNDLESLIGFKEVLDIRKSTRGHFMTICHREPREEA